LKILDFKLKISLKCLGLIILCYITTTHKKGNDNYSDIQEIEDNESKLDNKHDIELIWEF
jgi:hypothetical protein